MLYYRKSKIFFVGLRSKKQFEIMIAFKKKKKKILWEKILVYDLLENRTFLFQNFIQSYYWDYRYRGYCRKRMIYWTKCWDGFVTMTWMFGSFMDNTCWKQSAQIKQGVWWRKRSIVYLGNTVGFIIIWKNSSLSNKVM